MYIVGVAGESDNLLVPGEGKLTYLTSSSLVSPFDDYIAWFMLNTDTYCSAFNTFLSRLDSSLQGMIYSATALFVN